MCRILLILLLISPLTLAQEIPLPAGGSACVVAKNLGNSESIAWSLGQPTISQAIAKAKASLKKRGYVYVFPQANSPLPHGWLVVIKTEYQTITGRIRTSYGCGFSAKSEQDAEQQAQLDLQAYSWGWKPKHGYQVFERQRY